AIAGEIIRTPEHDAALSSIYQQRAPVAWYTDPTGAELASVAPALSSWIAGLRLREGLLTACWHYIRPYSYCLSRSATPAAFPTPARQEFTRRLKELQPPQAAAQAAAAAASGDKEKSVIALDRMVSHFAIYEGREPSQPNANKERDMVRNPDTGVYIYALQ